MNKQEFIQELTEALQEQVPDRIIRENVKYYREHVSEEAHASHRTEEEVIEEWGSPRLIAKTIIDAYEAEYGSYDGQEPEFYKGNSGDSNSPQTTQQKNLNMTFNSCLPILILAIVIVVVLAMILFRFIFSLPGLVICLLLILVFWYSSGHRGN